MALSDQSSELIKFFSASEMYSRPYRPLSLRVFTKEVQDKESLNIELPEILHPSSAGLGEMIGVHKSYEYFEKSLENAPYTQDQSVRLYIEEYNEDSVCYWNAVVSSVFQAIWDEVKLVCNERRLTIESVELR